MTNFLVGFDAYLCPPEPVFLQQHQLYLWKFCFLNHRLFLPYQKSRSST